MKFWKTRLLLQKILISLFLENNISREEKGQEYYVEIKLIMSSIRILRGFGQPVG